MRIRTLLLSLAVFSSVAEARVCSQSHVASFGSTSPTLVLTSQRLRLSPLREEEFGTVYDLWTHNEVTAMSGDLITERGARVEIRKSMTSLQALQNSEKPSVTFGIYFRNALIGTCQIFPAPKALLMLGSINLPEEKWVSISYHLHPKYWSLGIASEATALITRFAFAELHVDGVHAETVLSNRASQRVLLKQGFRPIDLEFLDLGRAHYYLIRPQVVHP